MTVDLGGFIPDDEDDDRFERAKREFEEGEGRYRGFAGIEYAHALLRLMLDSNQPWGLRSLAAAAILYLVIPIDVFPDCIPGGFTDDFAVILAVALSLSGVVDDYMKGEKA